MNFSENYYQKFSIKLYIKFLQMIIFIIYIYIYKYYRKRIYLMSYLFFGTVASSVPPVFGI
jgi:heme O synthase-like polyprenyltransferase